MQRTVVTAMKAQVSLSCRDSLWLSAAMSPSRSGQYCHLYSSPSAFSLGLHATGVLFLKVSCLHRACCQHCVLAATMSLGALEEKEHEGNHMRNIDCLTQGLETMIHSWIGSWRRFTANLGRRENLRSHKYLVLLAELIILCKQNVLFC